MTVKEGGPEYTGPFKMSKFCPVLGPNYYEHLINGKCDFNFVQAWDLMMGLPNFAETINELQKIFDKKHGIEEKEYDTKDLYHMQIDA